MLKHSFKEIKINTIMIKHTPFATCLFHRDLEHEFQDGRLSSHQSQLQAHPKMV